MSVLLTAGNLELAYGERAVCRGISLEINQGEIVALIGANGAGKSTTLRAIAGQPVPRAGTIRFRGQDITRLPSHERALLGIALVPEGRRVFPFLTARENLELGGFKHRRDGAKVGRMIEGIFDMFPRLRERAGQNAGTLSGGEQQMLAIGRAMMSEPTLLCLDEPSLGLAPLVVRDISIPSDDQRGRHQRAAGRAERPLRAETANRGYVLNRQHPRERSMRRACEGRACAGYLGRAAPARGRMSDSILDGRNGVVTSAGGIGARSPSSRTPARPASISTMRPPRPPRMRGGRRAIAGRLRRQCRGDVTAAAAQVPRPGGPSGQWRGRPDGRHDARPVARRLESVMAGMSAAHF